MYQVKGKRKPAQPEQDATPANVIHTIVEEEEVLDDDAIPDDEFEE